MADEIETLDELIEHAELRDVVIHELVATRATGPDPEAVGEPAEELHAPGCPDDFAALDFSTRLTDDLLAVRCRIKTRNAYGSFHADAEVLFELPAPISIRNLDIMSPFVEQVGAPAVFPYIRTAVASLAAQLAVPATPLPLLRPGDVALGIEDPAVQEGAPGLLAMGKVELTGDDGITRQVLEYFVDAQSGELVRLGGDDVPAEAHEFLDEMAAWSPDFVGSGMSWEWMVRHHGVEALGEAIEMFRETEGDAAVDATLAEIDEAAQAIALEGAAATLGEALEALDTTIAVTKERLDRPVHEGAVEEREALTALLDASEKVMGELDEFRTVASAEALTHQDAAG